MACGSLRQIADARTPILLQQERQEHAGHEHCHQSRRVWIPGGRSKEKSRSSPAPPAASASASPAASPPPAASIVLNGFGKAADRRSAREDTIGAEDERPSAILLAARTCRRPLHRLDDGCVAAAMERRGWTSSSTMPASSTSRRWRNSRRQVGHDPRDQSFFGLPHDAARLPRMKRQQWGRIVDVASAQARRLALQVGLCRRQARHGRPHQGDRAGNRRGRHHLQRHLPRLRLHAAGRNADRGPGQGARHSARAGDPRRAARTTSRTSASPRSRRSARSRSSWRGGGRVDHRRAVPVDGGWTAH